MKNTVITIIVILALIIGAGYFIQNKLNYITSDEFQKAHEILNEKLDSLKIEVLQLKETTKRIDLNVDTVKNDIKDLKKGQKLIFDEVKKNQNSNFWELLRH